jgi:tetratricopeptide (TPR) repeat protein
VDPDNPVVKLCAEGMRAEADGRHAYAADLFMQAWETAQDDYEACIAAHFVARHQPTPEETLRWNQEALNRAARADADTVRDFYPSLYLNLGHAYEVLGEQATARDYYDLAAQKAASLPEDRYGNIVRLGIAGAQARTGDA